MMRFLLNLFIRKPDEIVEQIEVEGVDGIYAAFAATERRGNDMKEIRLTPNAYAWLCGQLKRETVTHVAGVPVRVIEVASV